MNHIEKLCRAVKFGNKRKAQKIIGRYHITRECLQNIKDRNGDTLLHLSFKNKRIGEEKIIDLLIMLLEAGLKIDTPNIKGKTIIGVAIQLRMREVIKFCLERGISTFIVDEFSKFEETPLSHYAIIEECRKFKFADDNNKEVEMIKGEKFIEWLIGLGIDFLKQKNLHGYTALYWAIQLNGQHILLSMLEIIGSLDSAQNEKAPIVSEFLEAQYASKLEQKDSDCRFNVNERRIMPYGSYSSRLVYDIVRVIMKKCVRINEACLKKALACAIGSEEEEGVVRMLVERIASSSHCDGLSMEILYGFRASDLRVAVDRIQILKSVLGKGEEINALDKYDQTIAFRLFKSFPNSTMLNALIEAHADFSLNPKWNENIVNLISRHPGNESGMLSSLLRYCRSRDIALELDLKNVDNRSPLLDAIAHDNIFVALELIQQKVDLLAEDNGGWTPLSLSCALGHTQVVEALIINGVNVNTKHENGNVPLNIACTKGQAKVVELLLDLGACLHYENIKEDMQKRTPLNLATIPSDMSALLLNRGLDVNVADDYGNTLLREACARSDYGFLEELLYRRGADVQNDYNRTVLHIAVNDLQSLQMLLRFPCIINSRDKDGFTALHLARNSQIATTLLLSGAHVDSMSDQGHTPLFVALSQTNPAIVTNLLQFGAEMLEPRVFQLALQLYQTHYSDAVPLQLKDAKRHLIKLAVAGFIDDLPYSPHGIETEYILFFIECGKEIMRMKIDFIDETTTLYNLLHRSSQRLLQTVDMRILNRFLNMQLRNRTYQHYYDLFLAVYNRAIARVSLLRIAEYNFHVLTGLPRLCVRMIILYLDNIELVRLIN